MICPTCHQEIKRKFVQPVSIRGKRMRVVKRTKIEKTFYDRTVKDFFCTEPIPLVIVERVK